MCSKTTSDADKVQALKVAVNGHQAYAKMAMSGSGVDRHLMGLKLIARENGMGIPELYNDDGFVKSTNYRISTSQVRLAFVRLQINLLSLRIFSRLLRPIRYLCVMDQLLKMATVFAIIPGITICCLRFHRSLRVRLLMPLTWARV